MLSLAKLAQLAGLPPIRGLESDTDSSILETLRKWIPIYNEAHDLQVRDLSADELGNFLGKVGLPLNGQQLATMITIAQEEDFQGNLIEFAKDMVPKILTGRDSEGKFVKSTTCPHCLEENLGSAKECRHCGAPF